MRRRNWTPEEDIALKKIVQENGNRDWTYNSLQLELLRGQHRSGKQCRQRWFNHLCPDIRKIEWAPQEEEAVFHLHRIYGNKWKKISEHFPGRTDNCIKNHFYSTLRRSLRRFNKYLGHKNSTQDIRMLKPTFLTQILNQVYTEEQVKSDSVLDSIKELPSIIYSFSMFKTIKNGRRVSFGEEQEKKVEAVTKIIEQFSKRQSENKVDGRKERIVKDRMFDEEQKICKKQTIQKQTQNFSIATSESFRYVAREIKPIITIIPKPFDQE